MFSAKMQMMWLLLLVRGAIALRLAPRIAPAALSALSETVNFFPDVLEKARSDDVPAPVPTFTKPELSFMFKTSLRAANGQNLSFAADERLFAIAVRQIPSGNESHSSALEDGTILDFLANRNFMLQRFFDETVCYETELGHREDEVDENAEQKFSFGIFHTSFFSSLRRSSRKGDEEENKQEEAEKNEEESDEEKQLKEMMVEEEKRMMARLGFMTALGQLFGADLDFYQTAMLAQEVNGSVIQREIAGMKCNVWTMATIMPPTVLAKLTASTGAAMNKPLTLLLRRAFREVATDYEEDFADSIMAQVRSDFCVDPVGRLLAASTNLTLGMPRNGNASDVQVVFHNFAESEINTPPETDVSPESFDALKMAVGGRCVDLRRGSIGRSDLGLPVNSARRLARINEEANGVWEAAKYEIWKGLKVSEMVSALGTQIGPLQLPLRSSGASFMSQSSKNRSSVPNNFDSRAAWPECLSIATIRNQGSCGSCWAFAASGVLADRICISHSKLGGNVSQLLAGLYLAPEQMVECDGSNNGCGGGRLDDAWRFLRDHGIPSEDCRPYMFCPEPTQRLCAYGSAKEAYTIIAAALKKKALAHQSESVQECISNLECDASSTSKTLYRAAIAYAVAKPGDVLTLQHELMTQGPVEVGFFVFSDFHSYRRGVYFRTPSAYGPLGGHAVRLLGWGSAGGNDQKDVDYWLLANSWSPSWGLGGFFRIRRGTNECGIETTPAAGLPRLDSALTVAAAEGSA